MRTVKNLLPVTIFIILAFYTYIQYPQIPQSVLNGVIFLPIVLTLLLIALCLHFNRSPVFFYVVLISFVNIVLGLKLANTHLAYALLSALIPLLFLILTLLPERGIISLRALPAYLILVSSLIVSFILINTSPEWANKLLLTDWLPARYFDWTDQSQSVLFISVMVFIAMLIVYVVRPSPHLSASLGILLMLIAQLHFGELSRSLNIFSSAALIMCLYAVLQESWRMAYLDELTELPGRRALREKFQKISGLYTVAMLDVDHFKKFNDTYGHDTGDAVLRMMLQK